jgi:hypothetical protein
MLTTTVRIGNGQKAQLTLVEEYLEEEDFLQGSSFRNTFRPHGDYSIHNKVLSQILEPLSMPAPLV